jgi:outer membrane immunogenic protein
MKTHALGTVSVLALSATGAFAGDPLDWTGPYAGLNAGVAILDGDAEIVTGGGFGGLNGTFDLSDTGFTGGMQAGWNWQFDQFVFGVEADINYVDVDDRFSVTGAKGTNTLRADYDWFATVRGRAGVAMNSALIYVTGGLALIDSELRVTQTPGIAAVTAKDSEILVGGTIGGGVEYSFSESWSAKAEYLYMNFESQSLTAGFTTGTVEPELHVIRAGINYHFCTGGPVFGSC